MRVFIAFLMLCSVAAGQSIVISGGDTIAFSSRLSGVESAVATLQNDVAGIRSDVSEIKTSIAALSHPKPIVQEPAKPTTKRREWYLVSESWCSHCPAAKKRFRSLGWPEANVLTIAECERRFGFRPDHVPFEFGDPAWQSEATIVEKPRKTITTTTQTLRPPQVDRVEWGPPILEVKNNFWGQQPRQKTVNWNGVQYSAPVCNNPNCKMCNTIRAGLYSVPVEVIKPVKPEQEPTPADVSAAMLNLMPLTADDILADVGCGDGRILIDAVRRFGCRGIGFEIDSEMAETARRSVKDAGLSSEITIITGDALTCFCPEQQGITACVTYLYPELLAKLAPKIAQCRVAASPFHEVPGIGMVQVGDVWIRKP